MVCNTSQLIVWVLVDIEEKVPRSGKRQLYVLGMCVLAQVMGSDRWETLRADLENSMQGKVEESINWLSTDYVWGILLHLEYITWVKQALSLRQVGV